MQKISIIRPSPLWMMPLSSSNWPAKRNSRRPRIDLQDFKCKAFTENFAEDLVCTFKRVLACIVALNLPQKHVVWPILSHCVCINGATTIHRNLEL